MSDMMMDMQSLASIVSGQLKGGNSKFSYVSSDTRELDFNSLFVALKGENFDGNDFLDKAQEAGASGALVSRFAADVLLDQVVVEDTLQALQTLSKAWREKFTLPVIGVTGTNGKTTTKTMLKTILSQVGNTHATEGNYNNDIGVPLTLLNINCKHDYSVVEMGASARAEIGFLASLASPKVGIITNTSAAHLDGFGDLEGVVRAKGELFQALPSDGVAILNSESKGSLFLSRLANHCQQLSFGTTAMSDVSFSKLSVKKDGKSLRQLFTLTTPDWSVRCQMRLLGTHNVLNAAAASAAAYALGIDKEAIVAGLREMHPVSGRFNVNVLGSGGYLIDDSYNANPASMQIAAATAVSLGHPVWFVMGDMFEMGKRSREHHARVGAFAKQVGVQRLFASGPQTAAAVESFGQGSHWYKTTEELSQQLNQLMAATAEPVTVLVKASRGMRFEKIIKEISKHFIEATGRYQALDLGLINND